MERYFCERIVSVKQFKSKKASLPGSSYAEVLKLARGEHIRVSSKSKRQPYVRSTYFNKEKVFISVFWNHIMQKELKSRTKRLKLYASALDLIANTPCSPETILKHDDLSILLHRFYGKSLDGVDFCVQIKQDKKSGRKDFMSVFDRKPKN
jgi:hypothetical protein